MRYMRNIGRRIKKWVREKVANYLCIEGLYVEKGFPRELSILYTKYPYRLLVIVGVNHILEGFAQRIGYSPPSPRSRLVQNVADAKLVRNLVKHRRFSIGSIGP